MSNNVNVKCQMPNASYTGYLNARSHAPVELQLPSLAPLVPKLLL